MTGNNNNSNINDYWDTYSQNYNLLADCLVEHNIDIQLLRNTINSYENYIKQLMLFKINEIIEKI